LQPFLGFLHLLNGKPFSVCLLCLTDSQHDLVDLLLQNGPLALYTHGDLLKLAMPDDNGVIVAGGDPTTEFLAVFGFKILTGSDKDVRCRIELQKLSGPLLCQVVGHHKERFLTQAQPL